MPDVRAGGLADRSPLGCAAGRGWSIGEAASGFPMGPGEVDPRSCWIPHGTAWILGGLGTCLAAPACETTGDGAYRRTATPWPVARVPRTWLGQASLTARRA